MGITSVEEMPVYRIFFDLSIDVEKATKAFAKDFVWLRIQMLRSSESVCANMSEGFYAQYTTEYLQSLHRCRREARETMTHVRYARGVNQLQESTAIPLLTRYEEGCKQLNSLIASIEHKLHVRGKSKPGITHKPSPIIHPPSTITHELLPSDS